MMTKGKGNDRNEGNKGRQFLAALAASFLAFSPGTACSWTAPVLGKLLSGEEALQITPEEGSWIGSLLTLGALIGSIPGGKLSDYLGRKTLLLVLAFPMSASWGLLLMSSSVYFLYAGRFLGGLCFGIMSVGIPTYISDISEPSVRGTLGSLFLLQINGGLLATYLIAMIDDIFYLTAICSVVPLLFTVTFIWMPESPVWLAAQGKKDLAEKSLRWLRGNNYDVEGEMFRIKSEASEASSTRGGFLDVFKSSSSLKGIFITFFLMVFQQFSGINAVIFYTVQILTMTGTNIDKDVACIAFGVLIVLGCGVTVLTLDRAGRTYLMYFGAAGMCVFLCGLAVFIEAQPVGISWLPVVFLCCYLFSFSIAWSAIPWVMMSELFPNSLKASAGSLTSFTSWGFAFLVTRFFQNFVDAFGIVPVLYGFSVSCFLSILFVAVFVPETKGKTIDEILVQLGDKKAKRKLEIPYSIQ